MKIAMVSEHASPLAAIGGVDAGGQNVHVAALSCALAELGHEVTVATRRDDPELPDRVAMAPGVVVEHVTAGPARHLPKDELLPHMPAFGEQLARLWADDRPDVVHSHFWMSALAALVARRSLGVPVVHTFHALGSVKRRHQGAKDTSPPERLRLEQAVARDVDRVIATCTDEVFELARMGAPRSRTSVVPCGVDVERFTEDGPVWPRGDRPRLLSIGRLVERKGVDTAIRALPGVPGAELVVAGGPSREELGSDPEAQRLVALAADLGVSDRVVMLGQVARPDVPALLRSADVVVCVPWYEPFGIVPLEAMACRRPVVASSVGGLVDTVADGVTGFLVPPRDPARLAAVLRRLIASPFELEALAQSGIDRARSRYSWSRIASETAAVYAGVLTGAGSGAAPVGGAAAGGGAVDLTARASGELVR